MQQKAANMVRGPTYLAFLVYMHCKPTMCINVPPPPPPSPCTLPWSQPYPLMADDGADDEADGQQWCRSNGRDGRDGCRISTSGNWVRFLRVSSLCVDICTVRL